VFRYLINVISRAVGFSKVEAKGGLILILIMFFAIVFSRLYVNHIKSTSKIPDVNSTELADWIAEVESSYQERKSAEEVTKQAYLPYRKEKFKRASTSERKDLNIDNSDETFEEPVLEKKIIIKDINLATKEELQSVRGIGPAYSERIIKYRDLLGGFATLDQLNEVYGLPPETVEELLKSFSVQSRPQPIQINSDSAKSLARHPYISYDLAWVIINYRKQNGDITSVDDLRKIKAIDEQTFVRIKPYFE